MYANMNLLTDEECNTLFKPHGGADEVMSLNPEYEICVGNFDQKKYLRAKF